MDREHFYATMNGEGTLDYEVYLNTKALLSCQKDLGFLQWRRAAISDRSPGGRAVDEIDWLYAAGYR
jgi:hypothetical protein